MKISKLKSSVAVVFGLLLLVGAAAPVGATVTIWEQSCDESQVNNSGVGDGSTDSTATGESELRYDDSNDALSWSVTWAGLEGLLSAIHVHGPAPPSESSMPHVFNIFTGEADVLASGLDRTSDVSTATVDFSTIVFATSGVHTPEDALAIMQADEAYVNIHSTDWPMGEIRCHLVKAGDVEAQDKNQQKCENSAVKGYGKVASARAKLGSKCAKDFAKGKLGGSVSACVTADASSKLMYAVDDLGDVLASRCAGDSFPTLGMPADLVTASTVLPSVAETTASEIEGVLFGGDPDSAFLDAGADKDGSKCQLAVMKAASKCSATHEKVYGQCAKKSLAGKLGVSAVVEGDLDDCNADDPKGKLATACGSTVGKLADTFAKKCAGVTLTTAFPGCGDADPSVTAACIEAGVACVSCQAHNLAFDLGNDCELLDNGLDDGSCVP